jgi:hypothetical protein
MNKIVAVVAIISFFFNPLSSLSFAAEYSEPGDGDKYYVPTTQFTRVTETSPTIPSGEAPDGPLSHPSQLDSLQDQFVIINTKSTQNGSLDPLPTLIQLEPPASMDATLKYIIVDQTHHGWVGFQYNPDKPNEFKYYPGRISTYGMDRFTYKVIDQDGNESRLITVTILMPGTPVIGQPEIERTGTYQFRADIDTRNIPDDAEVWLVYSQIIYSQAPAPASMEVRSDGGAIIGTVTYRQKLSRHGNHFYAEGLKLRPGNYQYHIETVGLSGGDIRTGDFNFTVEPEPREIPIHDVTVGNLEPTTAEITAEADGLEPWEKLKLVYWREDQPEEMQTISMTRPDDQSPYQADLSGLTPGMKYRYKFIVVEESTGQLIDETAESEFTTEAHPPVDFSTPTVQNLTFESADVSVQLDGLVPGDNVFLIYWRLDNPSDQTTLTMTASEGSAVYQSSLTNLQPSTRYQFTIVVVNGGLEMASLPELREFKTTFPPTIIPAFQIGNQTYQIEFRTDGMYRVSRAGFNSGFIPNGQAFNVPDNPTLPVFLSYGKRFVFHFDANGNLTAVDEGTYKNSYPPSLEFPQRRTYFNAAGQTTGLLSTSKDLFTGKITVSFSKRYYSGSEIDFSDDWTSDALSTYTFSNVPVRLENVTLQNVLSSNFKLYHVRSYYLPGTSPATYTTVPASLGLIAFSLYYPDRHENSAPTFMSVTSYGVQATNPDKLNTGTYWIKGSGADLAAVSRADRGNMTKTMLSDDRWVKIPQDVNNRFTVTVSNGVFKFAEYTICKIEGCIPGQKTYTGKVFYSDLTGRVLLPNYIAPHSIQVDDAGNLKLSLCFGTCN